MMIPAIDELLKPIARDFSHAADHLLDFREAALLRQNPGRCVRCYFKLYGVVAPRDKATLFNMRRWIEEHMEVVARDAHRQEIKRIPIDLREENLESFCHRTMTECYHDASIRPARVELRFEWLEPELVS